MDASQIPRPRQLSEPGRPIARTEYASLYSSEERNAEINKNVDNAVSAGSSVSSGRASFPRPGKPEQRGRPFVGEGNSVALLPSLECDRVYGKVGRKSRRRR